MLEKAIKIAVHAHTGQKDRAGEPYILHPLRIMLSLSTDDERICGVLHDVVEDTDATFDSLRSEGFSEEILTALECLTKNEGEEYDHYIGRVLTNPLAVKVKTADLNDNLLLSRIGDVTEQDFENMRKYHRALMRIRASSRT
jgi:(p)ppGpp synthase/HD superfamily hydrolase